MKNFTDHFSSQAEIYARYRPTYPRQLFVYLQSLCEDHKLAWDCGTGNGQSAVSLAEFFQSVYATEPSPQQVQHALQHPRITYKIEQAEDCGLPDASADLITVSQALHWFKFDRFYAEAKRVLKPNGIIAAWAYGLPKISNETDKLVKHLHDDVLGDLWQAENRMIENGYVTIPFPFEKINAPLFTMQKNWSADELLGWMRSWSATQKYIDRHITDPVKNIAEKVHEHWVNEEMTLTWELILLVGKNNG